jgi:hypothetical protein
MRATLRNVAASVVTLLSLTILFTVFLDAPTVVDADAAFLRSQSVSFLHRPATSSLSRKQFPVQVLEQLRGGASASATTAAIDVEIESSDDEEEVDMDDDDEDEVEEETSGKTLAKAAKAASMKAKLTASRAASQATKAAIASTLRKSVSATTTSKKNTQLSWTRFLQIPYIIKACLNPFLFIQMTRGYWTSLFDYTYLDSTKVCSVQLLVAGVSLYSICSCQQV